MPSCADVPLRNYTLTHSAFTAAGLPVAGQIVSNWTTKFRSQQTTHMEPSATSTRVTGPVGERLRAGTEDAPVDRPAPLSRLHDSGAGYKYPNLLT